MTYEIHIASAYAKLNGHQDNRWEGEIFIPAPLETNAYDIASYVFRHFNRVEDEDITRLERMGYDLPSLSVGDHIAFRPATGITPWVRLKVDELGWAPVSAEDWPNPKLPFGIEEHVWRTEAWSKGEA